MGINSGRCRTGDVLDWRARFSRAWAMADADMMDCANCCFPCCSRATAQERSFSRKRLANFEVEKPKYFVWIASSTFALRAHATQAHTPEYAFLPSTTFNLCSEVHGTSGSRRASVLSSACASWLPPRHDA